jgi:hypothetical protein
MIARRYSGAYTDPRPASKIGKVRIARAGAGLQRQGRGRGDKLCKK